MQRLPSKLNPHLGLAIALGLVAVLWGDLITPTGITVWMLYLAPVALSVFSGRPSTPLIVAGAATVAMTAGLLLIPGSAVLPLEFARLNRGFGLIMIWTVALIARQGILNKRRIELRDWLRNGQRQLSAALQGEQQPAEFGDNLLRCLCEYLDAPVGALYLTAEDGALARTAAYAVPEDELGPERVQPGDGLLGQAMRDRRLLRLEDVPDDYLPVRSALGRTRPRQLVLVPLLADDEVRGVLELGFVRRAGTPELDLLALVADQAGIAVRSLQYRLRLEALLAQSREQAAELRRQQDELQAVNAELEAQSASLQESQARLELQQAELEHSNAQLEQQAELLARQRDDLLAVRAELTERADELTRANQYRSEFVASMSHELRTPLNSALVLSRLLADNRGGNLTPQQVRWAAMVHSAGNDLLALINDILDLSRLEAGRVEVQPREVEAEAVLETLRQSFAARAEDKGLAFTVEVAPGTPAPLTTDPLRLEQILRNLLDNALKFTDAGEVGLRVSAVGEGRVAFSVSDTGVGIAADQQEVIFEAFRQADGTTHRRLGGTGLGLTVARELARRLGGDISVASALGEGSTFTLELPVTPPPAPEPRVGATTTGGARPGGTRPLSGAAAMTPDGLTPSSAAAPAPPPPARRRAEDDRDRAVPGERTLLVISADAEFAAQLLELAHEQRYRGLAAPTPAEGLDLAEHWQPSGVALDERLPDGAARTLLDRLQHSPKTRKIPVHLLPAPSPAAVAQRAAGDGTTAGAAEGGDPPGAAEAAGGGEPPADPRLDGVRLFLHRLTSRLPPELPRPLAPLPDQEAQLSGRRILIVEDDPRNVFALTSVLEPRGAQLTVAGDGRAALAALEQAAGDAGAAIELVLMDIMMPEMDGITATREIRKRPQWRELPVIALTAKAMPDDRERCLAAGASDYIAKPLDLDRLLSLIRVWLPK